MGRLKGKARARASKKKNRKSRNNKRLYKKKQLSKIKKYNDPILKMNCKKIEDKSSEIVDEIITNLYKVLGASKNGVGLSAPQIGYTKRIMATRPDGEGDIIIYINPEIIKYSDDKIVGEEGCLSYPDFYTSVERSNKIKLFYLDKNNEEHEEEFEGFKARIISHECDHLSGVCLVGDAWRENKNS